MRRVFHSLGYSKEVPDENCLTFSVKVHPILSNFLDTKVYCRPSDKTAGVITGATQIVISSPPKLFANLERLEYLYNSCMQPIPSFFRMEALNLLDIKLDNTSNTTNHSIETHYPLCHAFSYSAGACPGRPIYPLLFSLTPISDDLK
jgi:hypothetical protein